MAEPIIVHEREQDDEDVERYSKRRKVELEGQVLPPSHKLLGLPEPTAKEGEQVNFLETDVGISEYIGKGVGKIEGIIKQR